MMKNRLLTLLLLVAGLVMFALPLSFAESGTTGSQKASEVFVTIQHFSFKPAEITVAAGTKVTWTNLDGVGHNVVFDDSKGPLLKKGESWSRVFETAGTYAYICGPHHFMKGTVIVQ